MATSTRADKYTVLNSQKERYSDFTINFLSHPLTNQLVRVTNEEAVKRSIKNLISTNKFERMFNPEIGGNIEKFLFEDVSAITSSLLKTSIVDTIEQYEPRANLIDVLITGDPDLNAYLITISFSIPSDPNIHTVNLSLSRVR